MTLLKTKITAKVDEVKAMENTLTEFRMEIEKQLDKKIGSESAVTHPPHFTTTFNIPVLICLHNTYHFYVL